MSRIRPRRLVHRGHVEAQGFVLDPPELGEGETRRRLLILWRAGAIVRRIRGRYVLLLAEPTWVQTDRALGAPLTMQSGLLSEGPLDPDEAERLGADLDDARAGVVLTRGGHAECSSIYAGENVDPSTWLDLSDYEVVAVAPLGRVPPPPLPAPGPGSPQLRDHIEDLPPRAPEAERMQSALHNRGGQARGSTWSLLRAGLAALWERAGRRRRRAESDAGEGRAPRDSASSHGPTNDTAPARPRLGWVAALSAWLTRAALAARLGRFFGQRQARYFRRLLDMFEDGELDQALRHAIPLSDDAGEEATRPSLSVPAPRSHLQPTLAPRRAGGSAWVVQDELYDILRRRYRDAFSRLASQGRIKEAAFVLADLLGETLEAVAFLERQGELRLAAELAEARGLPPAQLIRLWLLAQNTTRAVQLAKRHQAFAEAITLMQSGHRREADQLRLLWGDALAEQGDFCGAVEAVWAVPKARRLAKRWLDLGLAVGGPPAAGLLVRAVELMPERFDEWRDRVRKWLDDPSPEEVWTRHRLASALAAGRPTRQVSLLSKMTARALLRDADLGRIHDAELIRKLVRVSCDRLLAADLPALPSRPPTFAARADRLDLRIVAHDAGTLSIRDVGPLPKGRFLVALGDAGVLLVTRDGRMINRFGVPADRIVVSDFGHRALALARRGRLTQVARIDLTRRRATPWTTLSLTAHADTFDGWTWWVGIDEALTALDVTAPRVTAEWRNSDCNSAAIVRAKADVWVHTIDPSGGQLWRFETRGPTLRSRLPIDEAPLGDGSSWIGRPDTSGKIPVLTRRPTPAPLDPAERPAEEASHLLMVTGMKTQRRDVDLGPAARPIDLAMHDPWVLLTTHEGDEVVVQLLRPEGGPPQVRLALDGATFAGARRAEDRLIVFDDRGRLVTIDLARGEIERSLRIRA